MLESKFTNIPWFHITKLVNPDVIEYPPPSLGSVDKSSASGAEDLRSSHKSQWGQETSKVDIERFLLQFGLIREGYWKICQIFNAIFNNFSQKNSSRFWYVMKKC
jgi:hypothetical protein